MGIKENVERIKSLLPEGVILVAASKSRTPEEILEAHQAGIDIFGENYVQELLTKYEKIGNRVEWHFIGHLQRNKVKKIVGVVEMIQTLDNLKLAEELEKRFSRVDKIIEVLIEVNIAREPQKAGVLPEDVIPFVKEVSERFSYIKIKGLMTMGPFVDNPEKLRPLFRETKKLFDRIRDMGIKNADMEILSMGMSDSFLIAVEEGANMVRIGTAIFGKRPF
ncbi:MAG TPA: YggS family pyridoxal phosphate-dependent enzyme [candidate division WOR-3 bacterium]|uniref:Pyridoxal phosphate homeostasis protein n=1 Tax=candidate division WOR-3 bacterium TaxID=2052148 RepID=A0A7C0VDG3_UNCW3|nr:YggS family pyridoxal phosphate-dependent enzyme [candidate division WOR-3 bacterium]